MKRNRKHALFATALLAMILASCDAGGASSTSTWKPASSSSSADATSSSQRTEDPVKTSSGTSSSSSADKTSFSTSSSSSSSSSSSGGSSSSSSSSSDHWHGTSSDHSHESSDHSHESSSSDSHETSHVTPFPTSSEPSSSSVHEHEFGDWYDYNDEYHWHPATCGHSEEEVWEVHDMAQTVVAPTYESGGYTHHACKVCDYAYDDDYTDPLEHRYADEYSYDEETHWLACLDEGYEDEKLDVGDHVYGDWVVDTEATEETEGARHRECEVCGYVQDDVIEPLPHVHQVDNWVYSDIIVPAGSSTSSSETVMTAARHGECSKCHEDVVEELNYKSGDGVVIDTATYLSSVDFSGASAYKYMLDIGSSQQIRTQGYPYYNNWAKAYTPDTTSANALEEERLSHRIDANRISGLSGRSNFTIRAFTAPGETTYRYFLVGYAAMSSYSQESAVYGVNWLGTYTYYQYFKYTSTTQSMTVSMLYPLRTADEFNAMVESMSEGSSVPTLTYVEDLEYSSAWSYDEKKHWHSSSSSYGDFRSDEADHEFTHQVVEPTFETKGFTTHTCTVCGYSYTDSYVYPLAHNYSSDWTYDDEQHWRVCLDAGYETEEIDRADHQFGDWIIDLEPVPDVEGAKHRFCEVCGYREDATIDALPHVHSYSDEWTADATHHWHAATCAHTEEKADVTEHDYDAVVTPSTLKTKGYTTYTCKVCGYQYVSDETPAWIDQDKADFTFSYSGTKATITKYTGSAEHIYVPETVEDGDNTYTVTGIAYGAFSSLSDKSQVKSMYIPASVTDIANGAFANMTGLASLDIDPANTAYKFANGFLYTYFGTTIRAILPAVTGDVVIPEGVSSVQDAYITHQYDTISFPSTMGSYIDTNLLKSVKSVTVASGCEYYSSHGGMLFDAAGTTLRYIPKKIADNPAFPSTMTEFDQNKYYELFQNLTNVKNIDFSETKITKLPYGMFQYSAITSIKLPDTLTTIEQNCFYNCQRLTSLDIPDSVTTIGEMALYNLSYLETLHLPKALETVGKDFLGGQYFDLEEVTISDENPHFHLENQLLYNADYTKLYFAGRGAVGDIVVPDTITDIGTVFDMCSKVKSISVGDGVTEIKAYAFRFCNNLLTLNLGKAVKTFGDNPVDPQATQHLREINVDEDNPTFSSEDGVLYNDDKTQLIYVPLMFDRVLRLPDTVTSAATSLPFSRRDRMIGVIIPEGAKFLVGAKTAFLNCSGLAFIVSENGYTEYNVSSIAKTKVYASEEECPYNVDAEGFIYADKERTTLIGYGGSETVLTIPDTVVTISTKAFYSNTRITSVTCDANLRNICSYAFYRCTNLTTVNFNEGLELIEPEAFSYCTSLLEVVFPTTITKVGTNSFTYCASLTHAEFQAGSSMVTIGGNNLFGCCDALTELILPVVSNREGLLGVTTCNASLTEVTFLGTKDEWEWLNLGSAFRMYDYADPIVTVIHCSDGDILNPFAA